MNLFYIIYELLDAAKGMSILRQKDISPLVAVEKYRESETHVIDAVGGINNPAISRMFRQTITATVKPTDNVITIPDGAGAILSVEVDGRPYNVLPPEEHSSHGNSILSARSALVDGNKVTLRGLDAERHGRGAETATAEIVVESPKISTTYIEGLFAFRSSLTFKEGGKSQPAYVIESPKYQLFDEGELFGGTLRVVVAPDRCEDYQIAGNEYFGRNVLYVKTPAVYSPASWIRHTETSTTEPTATELNEYPRLGILSGKGESAFPAVVSRSMLPALLRPLVLIHAKWKLTGNPAFHVEYQEALKIWMGNHAR